MTAGMRLARVPLTSARLGASEPRPARNSRARNPRPSGRNLAGSQWLLPCNNWRMARPLGSDLAAALFKELTACRNRGIERIDVSSHNQQPLPLPELDRLAADYAASSRRPMHGRIPQLKYLLRDAVTAFREEDEFSAGLVSALFFGDSLHQVTKTAGELLDVAERESGTNAVRFRQVRHAVFERFTEFLPRFVAVARRTRRTTIRRTTARQGRTPRRCCCGTTSKARRRPRCSGTSRLRATSIAVITS